MRTSLQFVCVFAFLGISHSTFAAEAVRIQPDSEVGKDTFYATVYYQQGQPNNSIMYIGGWGDSYYSFIQFDLPTLPNDAEILSAELGLYQDKVEGTDNFGQLLRLTESWTEEEININSNPTSEPLGNNWSYVPSIKHWWVSDVTDDVLSWYAGSVPNYGWKIVGQYNNDDASRMFLTSDYTADPALRPYLEITYTVPEDEVSIEEQLEAIAAAVGALPEDALQRSLDAHSKKLVRFYEAQQLEDVRDQLAALERKVLRALSRGEIEAEAGAALLALIAGAGEQL